MLFISKTVTDRVILGKFWINMVLRTTPLVIEFSKLSFLNFGRHL